MIDKDSFVNYLRQTFGSSIVYFDKFKPDLFFVEIDCLADVKKKLSIEISSDLIKLSTIDKQDAIDFSLHDHAFNTNASAEDFLNQVHKTRIYIYP